MLAPISQAHREKLMEQAVWTQEEQVGESAQQKVAKEQVSET